MSLKTSLLSIFISLLIAIFLGVIGSLTSIRVLGFSLYTICLLYIFVLHLLVFIPSYFFKTEHYFDLTGSLAFLGTIGFILLLHPEPNLRIIILCFCIGMWAARLGSFLFLRIKKIGKDKRFDVMKTQFWWFLMTWMLSATWVLVSLGPSLVAITTTKNQAIDTWAILGISIWALGFLIEVIADTQKTRFKQRHPDTCISTGLWTFSRHPNYVGEVMLWVGLSIASFSYLESLQYLLLSSPLLIYVLLRYISGVNMLEKRADERWGGDPDYKVYKKKTPVFFPRLK